MRAPTVSTIVNQMKGFATKQIGFSIWQKLFHDHVISNGKEYFHVAEYIENNPRDWENDCFFVGARIARPQICDARGWRTRDARPYDFHHCQSDEGFCHKTNRIFHMAKIISRPRYPQRKGIFSHCRIYRKQSAELEKLIGRSSGRE
jgi:hypothetical protein